jgi:hypothetical protein
MCGSAVVGVVAELVLDDGEEAVGIGVVGFDLGRLRPSANTAAS